jgi:hypothetical protein
MSGAALSGTKERKIVERIEVGNELFIYFIVGNTTLQSF